MMKEKTCICKICGSKNSRMIYNSIIRDGKLGQYTSKDVSIFQCEECGVIWHDKDRERNLAEYYENKEYRLEMGEQSLEDEFYLIHDSETLQKFLYTGTSVFRNKVVADIGCGAGAFLDFVKGVSSEVLAVEPSETYRKIMSSKKGFRCFGYMSDAIGYGYRNKVDVVTSFDVIEHVEDPYEFLDQVYLLLAPGGKAIIGTPTDAPVMRALLGEVYEKQQLYSTQHLWILSEKSIRYMSEKIGFSNISFKYYQRYSIGNMLGWLREKKSRSEIEGPFITETMDAVWRSELQSGGLADYIVVYLLK